MIKSHTLQSIETLESAIEALQEQGIDNLFIVAAMAQVLSDLAMKTSIE